MTLSFSEHHALTCTLLLQAVKAPPTHSRCKAALYIILKCYETTNLAVRKIKWCVIQGADALHSRGFCQKSLQVTVDQVLVTSHVTDQSAQSAKQKEVQRSAFMLSHRGRLGSLIRSLRLTTSQQLYQDLTVTAEYHTGYILTMEIKSFSVFKTFVVSVQIQQNEFDCGNVCISIPKHSQK